MCTSAQCISLAEKSLDSISQYAAYQLGKQLGASSDEEKHFIGLLQGYWPDKIFGSEIN